MKTFLKLEKLLKLLILDQEAIQKDQKYIFIRVNNCAQTEKEIKDYFKYKFTQKLEYGIERFLGDPNEMCNEFVTIAYKHNCKYLN